MTYSVFLNSMIVKIGNIYKNSYGCVKIYTILTIGNIILYF